MTFVEHGWSLPYDQSGKARALGAEAMQESVGEQAEEEGWEKAEWFKLHLRPTSSSIRVNTLPPLPTNKTATDVFADFLRYLFQCAKTYIVDHYQRGNALWISLENSMQFILTHPNGWGGEQQAMMRRAAIIAGLIPNSRDGRERVHFVTEGEASLNFCILNGLATDPLNEGKGVVIVDAGGGTVDISAYRKTPNKDSFEEIARPQCLFEGSIFVSNRAKEHLQAKLKGSKYVDEIDTIRDRFDATAKHKFRNAEQVSYIKFGGLRDTDESLSITHGQMKLSGPVVASFFQPALDAIVIAVNKQRRVSHVAASSVMLVGGFAASEWLYSELNRRLSAQGFEVSRPDSHVNKAVSDGAVSFYLDHFVTARVAKYTYGIRTNVPYDADNAEHVSRSKSTYTDVAGDLRVPNHFSSILKKNIRVLETKEFREGYTRSSRNKVGLCSMNTKILCYSGKDKNPQWTDTDSEKYSALCTVHADTTQIATSLRARQGQFGSYYRLQFDVILSFGLTELKAQIAWVEDGDEKRSPAEIVYDKL